MSYIKQVAQEMKRVTWPSFKDVNRFTWVVILMIIFFSFFFALTDTAFSALMDWLIGLI